MACFTADRSSGDVVVVAAVAKGGTGLGGGANIGACPTGGSSRASAGDAADWNLARRRSGCRRDRKRRRSMRLKLQRAPLWRFRFAELFAFDRRPVPRQGNFARQWRGLRTGP